MPVGADPNDASVTYQIDEGLGSRSGANLFFGFQEFNVEQGELASFEPDGALATRLVLARVNPETLRGLGRDPISRIEGAVRLLAPGARLMMINPAGIAIGENASLDVSGSVYFSTADEVGFADGTVIPMASSAPIQVTSADPMDFGFFGEPGDVIVGARNLLFRPSVAGETSTLSFYGNGVTIEQPSTDAAAIDWLGGRIEIAAVPNETSLPLDVASIPDEIFSSVDAGRVRLSGDGLRIGVGSDTTSREPAGQIVIRGGRVEIAGATLRLDSFSTTDATGGVDLLAAEVDISGGSIGSLTRLDGAGASIGLRAETMRIADGSALTSDSLGPGRGGAISIEAGSIEVDGRSEIRSVAGASGDAGPISLAGDSIRLTEGSVVGNDSRADGNASVIAIAGRAPGSRAALLRIEGGGQLGTGADAAGAAGAIEIDAEQVELVGLGTLVTASTTEDASNLDESGSITLRVGRLEVTEAAQMTAVTAGVAAGGAIDITADDGVLVDGFATVVDGDGEASQRQSSISSRSSGIGAGGSVSIDSPRVEVTDEGVIDANSVGPGRSGDVTLENVGLLRVDGGRILVRARDFSGGNGALAVDADRVEIRAGGTLSTTTFGVGDAGSLTLETRELDIAGRESGLFGSSATPTVGGGDGGTIEIRARRVALRDGARIEARSTSDGDAGGIRLVGVDRLELDRDAAIETTSERSLGGDIELDVREAVILRDRSSITTAVDAGPGQGGNIDLTTRFLALDESRIVADAAEGDGGAISLRARLVVQSGLSPDGSGELSPIRASSELGIDGVITIETPEADLVGSLAPLGEERLSEPPIRATPCDERAKSSARSRLVVDPRRGLPPSASGWLPSWAGRPTATAPTAAGCERPRDIDRAPERRPDSRSLAQAY